MKFMWFVLLVLVLGYRDPVPPGYLVLNDIHIHETYTQSTENLRWLCEQAETLQNANIQFLVLNGDLTDSGAPLFSLLGPGQREKEWEILYSVLEKCLDKFPIFPVPGNHDRFMVESYEHATNENERKFIAKILARQKIDRFQGSYTVKISDQHFFFLDNSPFGVNRHFWARVGPGQLDWLNRKLSEISCTNCVTIFSHFPTGTFIPSERRKFLELIGNFSQQISAYHSGHIHRMFGSRAFTHLEFSKNISELSLIDFVSSGVVRWIPLDTRQSPVPVLVDLGTRDRSLPLTGGTRLGREGPVVGLVIDAGEAYLTNRLSKEPKVMEPFTGWKKYWFLNIYEVMHYMSIGIYLGLNVVLYLFWKYNKNRHESTTPVINNLIVIFGLLMPVMPWAVGYGWPTEDGGNEIVIAGIWGLVSLRTGERRDMDLITLHVIPLLLRTGFKCLMIYTSRSSTWVGKAMHYFSMAVVFLITVVGVKLLVLTYGPFLFLSPLALWELVCWGRKFYSFYLFKTKVV